MHGMQVLHICTHVISFVITLISSYNRIGKFLVGLYNCVYKKHIVMIECLETLQLLSSLFQAS